MIKEPSFHKPGFVNENQQKLRQTSHNVNEQEHHHEEFSILDPKNTSKRRIDLN